MGNAYQWLYLCGHSRRTGLRRRNDCLPEWGLNNLIAATTDGANNTTAIVAAQLCDDFEVDSQGNTPCQAGYTCYSDWFLPAGNNLTATGQLNCLYTNRVVIGGFIADDYLSSTEVDANFAWTQDFLSGTQDDNLLKDDPFRASCVRAFTP